MNKQQWEPIRKTYSATVTKSDGAPEYDIEATVTTATVDRMGDIVRPDGLDMTQFKRNPVILWAHDYSSLPVGRAVSMDCTPERLRLRIKFADYEFAQLVKTMYADGTLSAFSIGFRPSERVEMERGYEYLAAELLETSCVPVPANPEALVEGRSAEVFAKALTGNPMKAEGATKQADDVGNGTPFAAPEQKPESAPVPEPEVKASAPAVILPVMSVNDIADAHGILKTGRLIPERHMAALKSAAAALTVAMAALEAVKSLNIRDDVDKPDTVRIV